MKKSTKILGSVALSAALVMGTAAPAFANEVGSGTTAPTPQATDAEDYEVGGSTDQQLLKGENDSSTVVNVTTYTSQLNVTVPLKIALALDTNGGKGYAPSDNAYYIKNSTVVPITVKTATVAGSTDFALGTSALLSSNIAKDSTANAAKGDLYADFTPQAVAGKTKATTHLFLEKDKPSQTLNWVIGAKDTTSSGVTGYKFNNTEYTTTSGLIDAIYTAYGPSTTANWLRSSDKTAMTNAAGGESGTNWKALKDKIDELFTDEGAPAAPSLEALGSDGSVSLGFKIDAGSSILTNAVNGTPYNNAAKITYTVAVGGDVNAS